MVVTIECTMRNGKVVPLDARRVEQWKRAHKDGEVFDMTLSDAESVTSSPLARKFHAIRDEYAAVNGYDNEHAKTELKAAFGVAVPVELIPEGITGKVVTYYGNRIWLKSLTKYSTDELRSLVERSDMALQEAST